MMDAELSRRLDAIIALLVLTTSGILGIALVDGALGAAASVFVAGALVVTFVRSTGMFPAESDSSG